LVELQLAKAVDADRKARALMSVDKVDNFWRSTAHNAKELATKGGFENAVIAAEYYGNEEKTAQILAARAEGLLTVKGFQLWLLQQVCVCVCLRAKMWSSIH
jgi:hypothetical protein